jgi:hypothetical protein
VSSLVQLDVSYNHLELEGQVPKLGVFANTMGGFQMAGKSALCGGATRVHLPPLSDSDDDGPTPPGCSALT